jgi:hypothetical protein
LEKLKNRNEVTIDENKKTISINLENKHLTNLYFLENFLKTKYNITLDRKQVTIKWLKANL